MAAAARGRPPGSKSKPAKDALMLMLHDVKNRDLLRKVWDKVAKCALQGESWAVQTLMERLDGKVPQGIVGGDEEDNALTVQIIKYTDKPDA